MSSILPKNEQKNKKIRPSSAMIPQVELFLFVYFLAELRIPKSTFEIKGPLLTYLDRFFLGFFKDQMSWCTIILIIRPKFSPLSLE